MKAAIVGMIVFIVCLLVNCFTYGFFAGLFTVAAAIGLVLASEHTDTE